MKKFDLVAPTRSRWGNPKVAGKFGWQRPSSLAKYIESQDALQNWKLRTSIAGVAKDSDLIAAAATTPQDQRGPWSEIIQRGIDAAGGSAGRTKGTALHNATELADYGESLDGIPEDIVADVAAYRSLLSRHQLSPVAAELFVANEPLKAAGSLDRLV